MGFDSFFDSSGLNTINNISLNYDQVNFSETFSTDYLNAQYEQILEAARIFAEEYWKKAQRNGFGVNILDDIVMLFVFFRFLILTIRYNIGTSFVITASSTVAGWLWYNNFITLLFYYENALYKNVLTFRLGLDATQIRRSMEGRIESASFDLRITNPWGILGFALAKGSKYGEYRIDPISMITASALDSRFVPKLLQHYIESVYYLFYRELIPLSIRILRLSVRYMLGYVTYMGVVRVGKEVCPYIIRWHWTFVYLLNFIQINFLYIIQRANEYSLTKIYPKILAGKEFGLYMPRLEFEMKMIYLMCFSLIIGHLCFVLYGMFHALMGQYFYVPFFTENIELHIGPRNKKSIYSGGYTAWQDKEEQPKGIIPKFWYGWFGRGTLEPNFFILLIDYFIFFPIYKTVRKIIYIIRRRFWW